jgi:hypothetical protein
MLPGSSPAKIRPGRPIYGPEALLRNIEYTVLHNSVSGPEIGFPGMIAAEFWSAKQQHRSFGRHSAGRRADFEALPIGFRPKSGPEDRFPARTHYRIS